MAVTHTSRYSQNAETFAVSETKKLKQVNSLIDGFFLPCVGQQNEDDHQPNSRI